MQPVNHKITLSVIVSVTEQAPDKNVVIKTDGVLPKNVFCEQQIYFLKHFHTFFM